MAKRKSIRQINDQAYRLQTELYNRGTVEDSRRAERVQGIVNRYRDRIARANGYRRGYRDPRIFGLTGLSRIGENLSATRNVYMGFNSP